MIIQSPIKFGNVDWMMHLHKIRHQRHALADRASTPEEEMKFINRMIGNDSKNYHAWSYRQWVVSSYKLWDQELLDVERLINEDVRNNSAWNQRYFVVLNRPSPKLDQTLIEKELTYSLLQIKKAPNNESPWNFLQGYLECALNLT